MNEKRKTSNEKSAQIYRVAAKAVKRLLDKLADIDTTGLNTEHLKEWKQDLKQLDRIRTDQSSLENKAEHHLLNLESK